AAVDMGLPHPAGDQLVVLGAEIDDQDHGRPLPGMGPWGLKSFIFQGSIMPPGGKRFAKADRIW
ncbi:MAG: hypothetical protein PVI39_05765, partial [Desulfobacteraceae bacterium]